MPGFSEKRQDVLELPLWNSSIFRSKGGAMYQNSRLMKKGVHTVKQMIYEGELDKGKMRHIPITWRGIYRSKLTWLIIEWASMKKEVQILGPRLPGPQEWTLRRVAKAQAEAKKPG